MATYEYDDVPFNASRPLREVWTKTDRPFKSSKTQDLIKKDTNQTKYSNREIISDLGKDWKDKLNSRDGCSGTQINIGTLSLKETYEYLLNSDSISRLTHNLVRQLVIFSLAGNKNRFKTYLTTIKGDPIIIYRDEVGEYTNNTNFLQLNSMIYNVLHGKKTMDDYIVEFRNINEEYQIKRFINQYKASLKWIKSINCKNDDELENVALNLLDLYHLTFHNAEDEVKEAITNNTMKTENTTPYKIQNILSYYINTTYDYFAFNTTQQDRLNDILVKNFD